VPGENKVTRYFSYILMSKLSGNCAANCEFQFQLLHSQLQLQLQLGKKMLT